MKQKTLALLLKLVIIGVAVCAAAVYAFIVPEMGRSLAEMDGGEFAHLYTPWIILISLTAVPVAAALVCAFIIAVNIGRDKSFCLQNAKLLAVISVLAAVDTAFFFTANLVMLFLNASHPGIVIVSLFICFAGVAVTVAAAALSHYARKAAELQSDSDLTI